MGHPIREMARLTTRSKQIDGMGFGGVAADNLEVAGALGMSNPRTGKKLSNGAYWLARVLYCDDQSVKHDLIAWVLWTMKGDGKGLESMRLTEAAIEELRKPRTIINRTTGERELRPYSYKKIGALSRIKNLSGEQKKKYEEIIAILLSLDSDVLHHLNQALNE